MMSITAELIASVSLGCLVLLSQGKPAYSLEESDKIVVAVYEHEIREYLKGWGSAPVVSFCLMMNGLQISQREDGRPLGHGASDNVVTALRGRGFDVFSSNDCAYRGFDVFPRSSSNPSVIIGIKPFQYEGKDVPPISSHYLAGRSCEGKILKLRKRNRDYEVIESTRELIC